MENKLKLFILNVNKANINWFRWSILQGLT